MPELEATASKLCGPRRLGGARFNVPCRHSCRHPAAEHRQECRCGTHVCVRHGSGSAWRTERPPLAKGLPHQRLRISEAGS
jgi:hypothetical protein